MTSTDSGTATARPTPPPTFGEALGVWFKIGLLSFGGPAGQIAMMHRVLVDERKWIAEKPYLAALNFCMLLPGPEAMQLATYVGWRLHGLKGGLAAGLLFVLPGAVFMLLLSTLYAIYGKLPLAEALFVGIKAAVLAIVVEALLKVSRRALKGTADWVVAAIAFVAIYALGVPFPVIVLAAGLFGYMRGGAAAAPTAPEASVAALDHADHAPPSLRQTATTVAIWLAIWIIPLLLVAAIFGRGHVLSELSWFFSKLAVVSFGGAYALLAYMAQEVVQGYGWLAPGEMLDALGLAETTPGPLILVNQFVGGLAAFRHGSDTLGIGPVGMGVVGAVVTLWATFAPCFLWIFAGAPWIERLNRNPQLKSALQSVTAAVVGVILNLTVWFGVHVLFGRVTTWTLGPLQPQIPDLTSVAPVSLALSLLAVILLFVLHRGIIVALLVCGALAVLWHQLTP